jgi:hypothetical protein
MSIRVVLTLVAIAVASRGTGTAQDVAQRIVTLAVKDRSNATPWVAARGSFVAVAWGGTLDGNTDVFVAVSRDGGNRFAEPVQVNAIAGEARLGGELPPRVELLGRANGDPEIIVLWTARGASTEIKTARSSDGGKSFSFPVTLQSSGVRGDRGWAALAIDKSGEAHAIWLDHRGLASDDNQKAHADHKAAEHDGTAMAQRSGLFYAAGEQTSWRQEQELTTGVCYCCKTALAVAPSGTIYAAWRHVYSGNFRDIAFTSSRDAGRTFATPTRISEDQWQLNGCPDDGPAMAVDGAGTVHVVWPTVLTGPVSQGALFYATSSDGRTFTPRVRVSTLGSPKPSHPQIAVDAKGRIILAWDEVVNGTRTAVVREVLRGSRGEVTFGQAIKVAEGQPSLYPVLASTAGAIVSAWTAGTPGRSVIQVRRLEQSRLSSDFQR